MKKLIILFGMLLIFAACQYETIKIADEDVLPPIDDTVIVSFATDILPVITDHNCTACHTTGKTAPDLTTANAYHSLVSGGFVVSNNPEGSLFYSYIKPEATTHRWEVYSKRQAELIFTWINQGALNN